MSRILAIPALLALVGCAAIEPNSVRVYAEHVSHVSQHFGTDATSYGYNSINLEVHYQKDGYYLDVAEGINLNSQDKAAAGPCYGAMYGPREMFTAKAGYEFQIRGN